MATIYLRNVPDDLVERLQRLATLAGTSLNAVAIQELAEATKRADNPALLGRLPDLGMRAADIVAEIEAARSAR